MAIPCKFAGATRYPDDVCGPSSDLQPLDGVLTAPRSTSQPPNTEKKEEMQNFKRQTNT
jgi:hypothetical protein